MAYFRALLWGIVAAISLSTSFPVLAQVTAYAAGQGGINNIEVGVPVRASVLGRCGFASGGAPSGRVDQADFDQTGLSQDFAIQLNCTGASRIAVTSLNGGMASQPSSGDAPQKAPYRVALFLVADNGTNATASCDAAALVAGGNCAFSGAASQSDGLKLAGASTKANGSYLRVSAPRYAGSAELAAGRYSDTLSITISVSP